MTSNIDTCRLWACTSSEARIAQRPRSDGKLRKMAYNEIISELGHAMLDHKSGRLNAPLFSPQLLLLFFLGTCVSLDPDGQSNCEKDVTREQ